LMRRIGPTGGEGFTMGSPVNETGRTAAREAQVQAVLTKGYYAGVYEVTQGQWYQVMGDTAQAWPSKWSNNDYKLTRPVEQVSYYDIRENINNTDDAAVGWPANDAVTAGSFMGRLRSKTGLAGFDLPTEAQWEYACRAGTTDALNDGTVNITNSNSDARLDLLGRYQYNGGKINGTTDPLPDCTTANATAAVGTYAPNAWGLYDMHGNVWEWCLDWFADAMEGGEDPDGADSGSGRVRRGGSWNGTASACRSAYRDGYDPSSRSRNFGFRLFRTLP
ncbi:MAG: formylglycine-generating enzyme family protein, partial [Kiritimatiellae bacterium]|nr:formylglycine-generating enzyme family protein [Kiritimatiellia bacterium]